MGKDAFYVGRCYLQLAPKEFFFRTWRNNRGKISEKENNEYYIREFYHQILEELDPETVYNELDNSILLCYENNDQFCHRHIVAAWLELYLGIEVHEIKIRRDNIEIVNKPTYIKEYLENIIKENKDIKGLSSLRELYLFEKKCKRKELYK